MRVVHETIAGIAWAATVQRATRRRTPVALLLGTLLASLGAPCLAVAGSAFVQAGTGLREPMAERDPPASRRPPADGKGDSRDMAPAHVPGPKPILRAMKSIGVCPSSSTPVWRHLVPSNVPIDILPFSFERGAPVVSWPLGRSAAESVVFLRRLLI